MIKKLLFFSFLLIFTSTAWCQQNDSTPSNLHSLLKQRNPEKYRLKDSIAAAKIAKEKMEETVLPKPIIGLGVGMLSYYGELSGNKFANLGISRVAYELGVSEDLTDYFNMRFFVLFGQLGANERGIDRNLNFESQIRLGGINLTYNFDQLLPKKRIISPYITTGIETFEFLSKTDLRDAKGNPYYYWQDGSIKNLPEDSPNKSSAVILQRDYTYETDLRESNFDKIGKYPERSFAIPVGAGAILHVNDRLDFKIGTTVHFTFTDNIDNISSKGEGVRQGNSKNDRFVMSSFSLQYHLFGKDKKEKIIEEADTSMLAMDTDDEDADGVVDFNDASPFTPKGEPVDVSGTPLDDDKDLIANFKDDEIESPLGSIVNPKGVQYTDTMMEIEYLTYIDSTGAFAHVVDLNSNDKNAKRDIYKVQLGAYKSGIPTDLINKYLSIKDISSTQVGDSLTVYTAGKYTNYKEANTRKVALVDYGIKDAAVVVQNKNKLIKVNGPVEKNTSNTTPKNQTIKNPPAIAPVKSAESNEVIYRVQVGAYKNKVSKDLFASLPQLISFLGENGITRYVTGNYPSYNDAAKAKVDILLKGFEGAFIVAYKGGKRVKLESLGVNMLQKNAEEESTDKELNSVSKDKISFSIQVGVFKSDVPSDILNKFVTLKDIEQEKLPSGSTRYTVGKFSDYKSAVARKNELTNSTKLEGAFIIAFFNGKQIDVNEANELLNK